jgi:hypothetical protein
MKTRNFKPIVWLAAFAITVQAMGAIIVDTTPGTGAPPAILGGYPMGGFPADSSLEGSLISSLTPPATFPGSGDLLFTTDVEHMVAGSAWDTWSHGYSGDVYFNEDDDLLMLLPDDTLSFYLYIQPNLKSTFEFGVNSGVTFTFLDIDGDGGASYVGFYTDDTLNPMQWIYVRQTTENSDGFAVGEFGINVGGGGPQPTPDAGPSAMLFGGIVAGLLALSRRIRA